jgi:hypothetical protein
MSQAFIKFIGPNGTNDSESNFIHQTSPAWVLTFIRWNVRDTLRAIPSTGSGDELLSVRSPLVVENDCINLSVNVNKGTLTPSMQAVLKVSDVNYTTSIAPGDFVFVNMLNWEVDARRIVETVRNNTNTAINRQSDGFKGLFKVQSVREKLGIDANGNKSLTVHITGFGFTEFNNSIYFNPYLRRDNQGSDKDDLLFVTNIGTDYSQLINPDTNPLCQDLIKHLIQSFIGVGVSDQGVTSIDGIRVTENVHFYIPQQVGTLLGVQNTEAAKDIYNYVFGIQQYSGSANSSLATGTNPSNLVTPAVDRFYYTDQPCAGTSLLKAEYWNQLNAWSILNQYVNAPLNELYTCFKISPSGYVMPTVIFRQIPFTSESFGDDPFDIDAEVTYFLNLPRWKVSSGLIISTDLGRDEAARINFVQYYAQPPTDPGKQEAYMSAQTGSKNYVYDINDVSRSGLRPMVVTTSFEDLTITNDENIGRRCALIVGDAVIGEHLKFNGTIECAGIVDPIAVGDNFEYNGNVYHIEEVNHVCSIEPAQGNKIFRTILRLSHGVSLANFGTALSYPEMIHTSAYRNRQSNFENGNGVLPGVSEEQDVSYRTSGSSPSDSEINAGDQPFAQPGQVISSPQDSEDDSE